MSRIAGPASGRRPAALAVALLLASLWTAPAAAQRLNSVDPVVPRAAAARQSGPSPAGAFLASALVPGAGQYRLDAGRWVAYLGVELWAWLTYIDARSEVADLGGQYRDLAWAVARRISVGARADREFEYYEAMSSFGESGSFDADPGTGGVQPEEDETTFNGTIWSLARAIYYPAGSDSIPPTAQEHEAALDYYERNAIEPAYAWSWGGNQLEHEHFRTLIRRSDEAARAGTTILGVILVNHVVSAVDALIAARLRDAGHEPPLRLRSETIGGPFGPSSYLVVEIPLP